MVKWLMRIQSPLTKKTYLSFAAKFCQWIKRRECGFFLYYNRAPLRIYEFINDKTLQKKFFSAKKTQFVLIDLDNYLCDSVDGIITYLKEQLKEKFVNRQNFEKLLESGGKKNTFFAFFIIPGEKLLTNECKDIYHYFAYLWEKYQVSTIIHFNTNVLRKETFSLFSRKPCYLQNRLNVPLYESYDGRNFCKFLLEQWGLKLDDQVIDIICRKSGNHFSLVKKLLHLVAADKIPLNKALKDPSIFDVSAVVFSFFSPEEQQIIKDIVANRIPNPSQERDYLLSMRFIKKENGHFTLSIPLLENYIKYKLKESLQLGIKEDAIVAGEVNIDTLFTPKEKTVMKLLISRQPHVVNRDELANALWGEKYDEFYSDWAIDQLVSRLRKKLRKVISKEPIATLKRRGFVLR